MDLRTPHDSDGDDRTLHFLALQDGTRFLFDPAEPDAWIQWTSPVGLPEER